MRSLQEWKNFKLNKNTLTIEGNIDLNASAAVLATTDIAGATVAKTGTGEYTITLGKGYKSEVNCQLTVKSDTDADVVAQIDSIDVTASTKTVVIKTMVGAVPTDVSGATTVYFMLVVKQ